MTLRLVCETCLKYRLLGFSTYWSDLICLWWKPVKMVFFLLLWNTYLEKYKHIPTLRYTTWVTSTQVKNNTWQVTPQKPAVPISELYINVIKVYELLCGFIPFFNLLFIRLLHMVELLFHCREILHCMNIP